MSVLESGTDLSRPVGDKTLTAFDRQVFESLQKVLDIPGAFKEYMAQYMALNQPPISIQSVIGFTQFTATSATQIATSESTASTSPTDLTTSGPTLTGLPDGVYIAWWGADAVTSPAGSEAYMGLKANTTEPDTSNSAVTFSNSISSVARAHQFTLDGGGNNTLLARYWAASAGTGTWRNRWLLALKIANP